MEYKTVIIPRKFELVSKLFCHLSNNQGFLISWTSFPWERIIKCYEVSLVALIFVLLSKMFPRDPYVVAITFTNFVANTGGLLGLCLGFSFVSAVEILYHCFLRK